MTRGSCCSCTTATIESKSIAGKIVAGFVSGIGAGSTVGKLDAGHIGHGGGIVIGIDRQGAACAIDVLEGENVAIRQCIGPVAVGVGDA